MPHPQVVVFLSRKMKLHAVPNLRPHEARAWMLVFRLPKAGRKRASRGLLLGCSHVCISQEYSQRILPRVGPRIGSS